MLSNAAYFKSESAADKLIDDFKISSLPVPIFEIVPKMNLQLIEYNLGGETSGVLVIENGIATIGYNPKDAHVRKRFTIAHELGHYILHRSVNELFVDNFYLMKFRKNNSYTATEYKQEQEANAFAAALLMPERFINAELALVDYETVGEAELISMLASKFEVSVPAMSYRLANLNMFVSG